MFKIVVCSAANVVKHEILKVLHDAQSKTLVDKKYPVNSYPPPPHTLENLKKKHSHPKFSIRSFKVEEP